MIGGLFVSMFVVLLVCLWMKTKKMVSFIILGETVLLSLIFMLMTLVGVNFYVILVCLLVGVCEASMGLSFVVVLIRKNIFFFNNIF